MTRTIFLRRIVAVAAVALALGTIAGPASARTFDFNSNGSLVQQQTAQSIGPGTAPASSGSSIDWGYVAIGSSVVALVLIGVGGAVTIGRRRAQQDKPQRATPVG